MTDNVLAPVLQDRDDAQSEHDASKHASLHAGEGVLEGLANAFRAEGHEAIAAFLGKANAGFADDGVDVLNASVSGSTAAIEYTFSATNMGLISIPGATNKRIASRAVTFFELRDGKIARSWDYGDSGAVIDQLGATAKVLVGIGRVFGPHWKARP